MAADTDGTLGIVGDGPERDALEAQADALTHADRIDFLGVLDDDADVCGHMRAADVFCSPNTREGFRIRSARRWRAT
ncbi:glycosyltransferase [Halorubrum sp. AJ67]|uniref:glycosyltransferase n=1 Tax=Halorubrum sp. AJ67 TaxID=1173487 RepID=UPI002AA2A89F|nr:glycosyltransferase [Halorubrum sp. AJ67]